jgi:hypothetical protein
MLQKFLILFLVFFGLISPLAGQSPQPLARTNIKEAANSPAFKPGERLNYTVKWNDMIAARVVMAADQAQDKQRGNAYKVEIKVDTVGVVKDIIQVSDQFIAFLDPKTHLPFRAERNILEGPKNEKGLTVFDQEKHLATVADEKPVAIAPETHDIASIFWAIRKIDLKSSANEKIQGFNSGEKKMFVTFVEVGKREELTTAAGKFETVQLIIKLQDQKQPSDKYSIRMWITDDAQRLPVLITAQPPFGKVRMELVDSVSQQQE